MANQKLKLLVMFLAFTTLFAACQKDEEPGMEQDSATPELDQIPVFDEDFLLEPEFLEATESSEMVLKHDHFNGDFEKEMPNREKPEKPEHPQKRLKPLFLKLNLSDDQQNQLKRLMHQKKKCVHEHFRQLKRQNHIIIRKANAHRKGLIEDFRNGDITRAELQRKLKQLNDRVREHFRNDDQRKRLIDAIKKCHREFHVGVHRILNDRQWKAWLDWHKNHRPMQHRHR